MTMRVKGPNGVVVNFPDGTDPATIDQAMRQAMQQGAQTPAQPMQAQPTAQPNMLADIAKSAGAGLVRGGAGMMGLEGDINQLANTGIDWAKGKMGMDTSQPSNFRVPITPMAGIRTLADAAGFGGYVPEAPSSADVTKLIEDKVTGPLYQPKTTPGKFAETIGEFAPAAIPGGGLRTIGGRFLRQAVAPAVGSEVAGQTFEGTPLEPYARAAGAAAGSFAPSIAARALTPFPAQGGAARRAAVQTLRAEGVEPTAGQATGSRTLKYFESEVGGPRTEAAIERQGEQFTAAILKRIGEDAPRATPDVMNRAFDRIGQQFDQLAARNSVRVDPQLTQEVMAAERNYSRLVAPSQQSPAVNGLATDIINHANQGGVIPGKVYQAYRSDLDSLARSSRADPHLSRAFAELRSAVDDAMERSIVASGNASDIAAWREARRQYRDILVVQNALGGAGELNASGIISPARLRQAAVTQNKRGFVRGQGDFAELAQAGQSVLTPLPQSGTAPRMAARGVPEMLAATLGGTAGSAMGPMGTMAGVAAGLVAPKALGWTAMSKGGQKFLGNQKFAAAADLKNAAKSAALVELIMGPRQPLRIELNAGERDRSVAR